MILRVRQLHIVDMIWIYIIYILGAAQTLQQWKNTHYQLFWWRTLVNLYYPQMQCLGRISSCLQCIFIHLSVYPYLLAYFSTSILVYRCLIYICIYITSFKYLYNIKFSTFIYILFTYNIKCDTRHLSPKLHAFHSAANNERLAVFHPGEVSG